MENERRKIKRKVELAITCRYSKNYVLIDQNELNRRQSIDIWFHLVEMKTNAVTLLRLEKPFTIIQENMCKKAIRCSQRLKSSRKALKFF